MKIPLPIRTFVWKIFGSVIIFLLLTGKIYSQSTCLLAGTLTAPSTTCTTSTTSLFNLVNSTPTGACGGATPTTTYAAWYKFTANSTGVVVTLSALGTKLTAATTYVQVLTGTCASFT